MSQFLTFAHALKNDEDGATMIEYTLLAALVSIIAILTITTVGGLVDDVWGDIETALTPVQG
ncbi:MAG: Flp family type IVb pilin [Rhodospirillaceae bacterium]